MNSQLNYITTNNFNKFYTYDWEVYVGNSPVWSGNTKCPGGPYLRGTRDDYFDTSTLLNKLSPAFGFEVFCNMEGQYTFLVATGIPSGAGGRV